MFLERLFKKNISASVEKQVKEKLAEAMPLFQMGIDSDDWQYRALTTNPNRDLNIFNQDRMIDIAYYLYKKNLTARRIIDITKDFVIGEGIQFSAEDDSVQEVLDDFWNDPLNQWDLKQGNKVAELGIFGEQIYPTFVNNVDGHVRIGYIDPKQISRIEYDEGNCEVPRKIFLRARKDVGEEKSLSVVNYDDDPRSKTYGKLVGECFFFAVNKVSNATRGTSDLFCLADWLDGYDKFLFNRLDRQSFMNAFVWDVTLNTAQPEDIIAWQKDPRNGPPKPGSIRVHNEKVKWEAVTPKMRSNDASDEGRMIKNHVLSGAGFPEHWFADGGNANRATAGEMGEPTIKQLKSRQKYVKFVYTYIFQHTIDQAKIHGTLSANANEKFQVIMPEISVKDTKGIATAMKDISSSTAMAQQYGWITRETSTKIFASVANQLESVEINVEKEMVAVEQEKEEEEFQDYTADEKKKVNEKPKLKVVKEKKNNGKR